MKTKQICAIAILFILAIGLVAITGCSEEGEKTITSKAPRTTVQKTEKPADINTQSATEQPTETPSTDQPLAQLIVGEWELAPNARASSGTIMFGSDKKYEINEQFHDGTGGGIKGEYILNSDVDPIQIDLCLDKCGGAGSEWTTRFGIIRVLSDGKLEIHTSPTDKHPEGFSDDTSDKYTLILTKME